MSESDVHRPGGYPIATKRCSGTESLTAPQQRADRPYATFYLSFNSSERSVPAITDWLLRTVQPQLATIEGVQRVTNNEGGRPIAMRIWIDPDRLAAVNLSPGDVYAALQRNNYLAAVGRTKGNLVQVNLLANTDLRSTDEFEELIVTDRGGAIVHPHGREGRLTALVNRGFERVRHTYARLLDAALAMRFAIVAAALLIMAAAWPFYMFSQKELAPVEDQRHISLFFEASPDSTLAATNRDHLQIVNALTAFPETEFTWSLTSAWGGFGGLVVKDWRERARSTEEMFGDIYGAVSQVPGLRVFPRLDPPLPTPGQYDVELVLQSDAPAEQMLETTSAMLDAGWQSGKFLYVDTDLKIDLPEARVVLDRERIADLGLDLAGVGRELGTLLGGDYVNRFNFFDRSYKVIPQIGEEDRATLGPLLDLKIKTPDGQLVPVSTFTDIETGTAPRTLNRFQQRNAVRIFGGVQSGVTQEEGLRVLETAAAGGPGTLLDYAGESRQIRREGAALTVTLGFSVVLIYLVLAAQFQSFRGPSIRWAALDLGRVRARIRQADARAEASVAQYELTVLRALDETENALVELGREQARRDYLGTSAEASEQAAWLAKQRFEEGAADFLTVLDAERTLLEAQDRLARSKTDTATALVALYKALGGGWEIVDKVVQAEPSASPE